jgi:hypothetical protein
MVGLVVASAMMMPFWLLCGQIPSLIGEALRLISVSATEGTEEFPKAEIAYEK